MENYAEIFGNIMHKKMTITRKRRQIYAEISNVNKLVSLA